MGESLTLDDLKSFDLQLFQSRHGYRYSLDPLLLVRFCNQPPPGGRIIDLGAGCGIISLLLARVNPNAMVTAFGLAPRPFADVAREICAPWAAAPAAQPSRVEPPHALPAAPHKP